MTLRNIFCAITLCVLAGRSGHAQQIIENGIPIGANTTQSTAVEVTVPAGGNVVAAVAKVAQSGGGTVTLEAGDYHISSSINLGSNVTINGKGSSTVIYAPPTPNGLAMIAAPNGGVSNVIIENLVLDLAKLKLLFIRGDEMGEGVLPDDGHLGAADQAIQVVLGALDGAAIAFEVGDYADGT